MSMPHGLGKTCIQNVRPSGVGICKLSGPRGQNDEQDATRGAPGLATRSKKLY